MKKTHVPLLLVLAALAMPACSDPAPVPLPAITTTSSSSSGSSSEAWTFEANGAWCRALARCAPDALASYATEYTGGEAACTARVDGSGRGAHLCSEAAHAACLADLSRDCAELSADAGALALPSSCLDSTCDL